MIRKLTLGAMAALIAAPLSACGAGHESSAGTDASALQSEPISIARGTRKFKTDALVVNASGSWAAELPSIKSILSSHGATYKEVSSDELNSMSVEELSAYGAIIWPGGHAGAQADSLSGQAKANLRAAVQERGVSWLGFCAGSFIAVEPASSLDANPSYGLGIVNAPLLKYYFLEEQDASQGVPDYNMTLEQFADGTKRDILWYGGPVTPSAPGHVVAKYPNGDAAISQLWSGNGFVVLSAVHPTATQFVLDSFGLDDSDGLDLETAWKLMDAAIHQRDLPAF